MQAISSKSILNKFRKYTLAMLGWSVLIGVSLAWNLRQEANETLGMAVATARTNINKDITFRKWVASHGGVYVPPTKDTPPNPYLKVPDRDVTTTTGKALTLMNPAYALRELQSMSDDPGIRSHITSLKLLNPHNVADDWEAGALKRFEQQGSKEAMEIRQVDGGQPHLRLMVPFVVNADCLKCHEQQGYKLGDIRGGISADVSLAIYQADEQRRSTIQLLTHSFIWLIGLVGLGVSYRRECRSENEQEQIEAALRESEELFRNYFNLGQVGMTITSLDHKWLHVNARLCEMLGYTKNELVKMTWVELTHPDDLELDLEQFKRLISGEVERYSLDKRFIHKSGNVVYTHLDVSCKRKTDRTIEYVIASLEDISERKQAENKLRASEQRYQSLFNNAEAAMFRSRLDGSETLDCNEKFLELVGMAREQVIGKPSVVLWEDAQKRQEMIRLLNKEGRVTDFEFGMLTPKGELRHCVTSLRLFRENGLLEGSIMDITKRKQAENALLESESRLRVIVENQLVCIVTVKDRIIQWANPAYEKLLGYEKGELNGAPARQIFLNDDTYQALGENAYPVINSGNVFRTELEYLRKDGSHITAVVSGGILNPETGESLWTCVDITERKLLEVQHRRLSAILMQSNEPVTLIDVDGRYVYANPAFCKLFGYKLDELLGKSISLLMPHDENSGSTTQQTIASAKEYGEFHGEVKRRTKDGTIIPLLLNVSLFQNEHGEQIGYVATMTDLTETKQIENQLRDNVVFSQTILNSVREGLHGLNRDGSIIFENPAATSMLGWDIQEMIGQPAHRTMHHTRTDGSPYPQGECHIYATLNDGVPRHILDEVFWRKDGTSFPVDYTSTPMRNATGEIIGTLVSFSDITERKRAEESLRITASVFDNSQEAIIITDSDNAIVDVNPAFTHITGYSRDDVIGRNPNLLSSGRQNKAFYSKMWESLKQNKAWRGEIWNRRKSGEIYAEQLSISVIVDNNDKVLRYVAVFSDISHIKEHEAELSHVAHFDALTGIPNRVLLADRMKQAIFQTSREQNMMAVCYLDLDGFKPINDAMGHDSGDQVLIEVARRIENTIRGGDTVARLGGDEFVVLLLGLEQGEECATTLERLLTAIAQPISVKEKYTAVSASIGVSIYPLDDEDPDTLLRHADQAMYVAKQSGKNRFHIYDLEMDRRARDQNEFLKSIRHGLEHNQFELYYQPKVNLRTRELVGAEALIRWRHPEHGLLAPAVFLRYIENTDLDIAIGEWVTATALTQMNYWRSTGLDIEVSINISGYHMESTDFVEKLRQQLSRYPDMLPGKLQIEVLETVALNDIAVVRQIIETCREIGVGFALDDFGTGYSSLSYLSSLPVDVLKIDQSFVRDMLEDKGDMAIVQGIIALARAFDRQTVAEGIETEEHYKVLLDMGCELGQGYGIARPMPAGELKNWRVV